MKKWSIVEIATVLVRGFVAILWMPLSILGFTTAALIDLAAFFPVCIIGYIVEMIAEDKYLEARKEGRP